MSITQTERSSVALGIQRAMRRRTYCHLWPTPLYKIFPRYLTNSTIVEKVTVYKMGVFISSTILSEIFLIQKRIERDMIKSA
jgi:hypothetical protein